MLPSADEIDTVLKALAAAPRRLTTLSRGLDEARLRARPEGEDWSVQDILAHLRACAVVWGGSIEKMLTQPHPTLRYVSPRGFMRQTDYAALPFSVSLPAYAAQRRALLKLLQPLAPADWARGATFTGTTKGREQIVLSYAQRLVSHEAEHLAQIEMML
jgi:hypothetical protein